jgi:hypothetical protein
MVSPVFHRLCYPRTIEAELKNERTKKIILLALAIIIIVAACCAAVILTNIFAPEILQMAVSLVSVATPYAFSLLALGPYNSILTLDKKIIQEKLITLNNPTNDEDARAIIRRRIELLGPHIPSENLIRFNVPFLLKYFENRKKIEFLEDLTSNPTSKACFKDRFTFHYKDYNASQITEMVRGNLAFCTHRETAKDIFWANLHSENPL